MTMLQRTLGLIRDSPTYGRDRVNLISAGTIGVTALILNGLILILVLPLLLDPDDRTFRVLTENVGFGQLLALILLGGASACATLVIPLRLMSVFWGPRNGRYFDQIVLSGISPLRFVIGKVLSQNLFLMLVLFLLLPWMVLSVSIGGVHPGVFLGGLLLVWLYCMTLALVTLWASLHMNELMAAFVVIVAAVWMVIFGLIPMPVNPFVLTPYPALIQPVYSSMASLTGYVPQSWFAVFSGSVVCMTGLCAVSLVAVYLGPLYGIISENSTFGEVVRKGDSRKRRWFRLRLHIQRPSEIAFFYENRSGRLRPHEGLIRWGAGLGFLLLPVLLADTALLSTVPDRLSNQGVIGRLGWIYEFHALYLMVHGFAVAAAILLFSHARNTTFQRQAVVSGRELEVARLDSVCFLLFLLLSTVISVAVPTIAQTMFMTPAGGTIFPAYQYGSSGREVDYVRTAVEGSIVIAVAGLTIYAVHRLICLNVWLRSASFAVVVTLYFFLLNVLPMLVGVVLMELTEMRNVELFGLDVSDEIGPHVAAISPFAAMLILFGETGGELSAATSLLPFYVVHGGLVLVSVLVMHYVGKSVRELYFSEPESVE